QPSGRRGAPHHSSVDFAAPCLDFRHATMIPPMKILAAWWTKSALVAAALSGVLVLQISGRERLSFVPEATVTQLAAPAKTRLLVKFAHPRVALTRRNWDAPLLTAISQTLEASNEAQFVQAVDTMLR